MKVNKSNTIKMTNNSLSRLTGFGILFFVLIFFYFCFNIFLLEGNAAQFSHDELSIPILTYHKFCLGESNDDYTININHFKEQMIYLKENDYRVISISQLLECIKNNFFPDKPVIITIDDGYKSVYTLAYPVLKELGFSATLFLYTDFIGHGSNQLIWEEIREMVASGMEIGSHTLSHANLLSQKANETYSDYLNRIKKEIVLSKTILEKNTGSSILSFAYPYGVYSQEIKVMAKEAGYEALLNVNNMNNSTPIDPFSLNRQVIPNNGSLKQFRAIVEEKTLQVEAIFPSDGLITEKQDISVGAILSDQNIEPSSLHLRLGGSDLLNYTYCSDQQKISFTPIEPKLLQKRTWIALITAQDAETGQRRKVSWLFTIK